MFIAKSEILVLFTFKSTIYFYSNPEENTHLKMTLL